MKKRILMLGAGFMQGVALRCAKARGWEVIAVDGNPQAMCRSQADRFEPIDLKDTEALAVFALNLKDNGGLDGVFTAATDFSASVAYVARSCNLPGHSYEAALNASDKLRMRRCFEAAGVPSPAFAGVNAGNRSEIKRLMAEKGIAFPVVVKPVDNMGARGCRKVEFESQLAAAIDDAIGYSRSGFAIVEEYMDGPEFSLEALVFDGEIHMTGFADRHIFFPPYFIEMGHTIPSGYPESDVAALTEVFKRGVRALGLSHGAAKGDMKLTSRGPMVGEIAGRLSGGYMSGWTFPYSSGIDLTGSAMELAVGLRPMAIEPVKFWTSAERAWISIPGKIASVLGYEKARAIPYVKDIFPRSNPGDTVTFPLNNVEKCGNCLAAAPARDLAITAAEDACRAIILRLAPANPATEAFLNTDNPDPSAFPPNAFALTPNSITGQFLPASLLPGCVIHIPSGLVPYLDSEHDWQGRTLRQALIQACELESGLKACLGSESEKDPNLYWKALLRGGIQGIVYVYDSAQK